MAQISVHIERKDKFMKAVSILMSTAWVSMGTILIATQQVRADPLVYIPLGGEGSIVVVDAATNGTAETITGIPAIHGLAGTPDGRLLIAGSFEERKDGSAAPAKPTGVTEDEHAAHHAAVPTAGGTKSLVSTVSILRASDGSVVRRIDVPGAVHHVAVTGDGRFAVATQPKAGGISLVDLADYRVAAVVKTGPMANYAVADMAGTRVYVSNAGNRTVSEVDTQNWIVRRNFVVDASPEHMVLSHDGQRLYVAHAKAGIVSEIALETGTVARTFAVGGKLHGIDLSEDGRTLFVGGTEESKLTTINLHTLKKRSMSLGPSPEHVTTVTGTGNLYVSSGKLPKIWVIDPLSLQILTEIPVKGEGHQMAVVQR